MIQLWEIPAEQLLRSSLATAPLAVLGKLPETLALTDGLASAVRQLAGRLERDASGDQVCGSRAPNVSPADRLLVAAYVLTGLRLKVPDEVRQLVQGVSIAMRESVTGAVRGLVLPLMCFLCGNISIYANSVTVHRAPDPQGPHVVLVVPVATHEASIGIARQVATLPLQRGTLTVIQAERVPDHDQLGEVLKRSLPDGERPNWVWVHRGIVPTDDAGQKITKPTIRLQTVDADQVRKTAAQVIQAEVTVSVISAESPDQLTSEC